MKVVVFAPHNDDEVLGVGGTIAKLSKEGNEVYVCVVTRGKDKKRLERIENEALKAHKILGVKKTIFMGLPVVGLFDMPTKELNKVFVDVVLDIKPEIVFVPHKGDMHLDHRMTTDAAMVALRPINNPQLKAIYSYETLSETEWNTPTVDNIFIPNVWSDITDTIDIKLKAMESYKSQLKNFPHPRSLEAILALSRLRGSTICMENAESFMLLRSIL